MGASDGYKVNLGHIGIQRPPCLCQRRLINLHYVRIVQRWQRGLWRVSCDMQQRHAGGCAERRTKPLQIIIGKAGRLKPTHKRNPVG